MFTKRDSRTKDTYMIHLEDIYTDCSDCYTPTVTSGKVETSIEKDRSTNIEESRVNQ